MLRKKPDAAMIKQWHEVFGKYKNVLKPNRKSGQELINYLSSKYTLTRFIDKEADEIIIGNVTENEHYAEKLPPDTAPQPVTFHCERNSKTVFIGIDLASGMYH